MNDLICTLALGTYSNHGVTSDEIRPNPTRHHVVEKAKGGVEVAHIPAGGNESRVRDDIWLSNERLHRTML